MAVRTVKFELNKDVPVEAINRFFQDQHLDRTQILNISVIQKTPNASVFMVTYEDVTPPYVVGTSPADGSVGVPGNLDVVVQMSEQVQQVRAVDVEVLRNGTPVSLIDGDIQVPGSGTWPSSVFRIANAVDSTPNANYIVSLLTTIQDLLGNRMSQPHVFGFTTATQLAGLAIKAGREVPGTGDILAGFKDVVFTEAFTNANYDVPSPGFHSISAPISGQPFRIMNKVAGGFRVGWDFAFPTGAAFEWLAIYGAPS